MTFCHEFKRSDTKWTRGLRYIFIMTRITVNNPVFKYRDNQSLLWNTAVPDYTLKEKSIAVAYNLVREGVARKEWITGYIKTSENCGGLMTKTVSSGKNRKINIRQLIYDIYPEDNFGSF